MKGKYYAVSDICTHESESLSDGLLIGSQVICPAHYAVFDVVDGKVLRHPEGATIEPVKTFKVRIENDQVSVQLEDDA